MEDKMKMITRLDRDTGKYRAISATYSGLTDDDAKKVVKELRREAKTEETREKYRVVGCAVVPR
jgi:hypothetical protein